jgi:hypothetical protein
MGKRAEERITGLAFRVRGLVLHREDIINVENVE